MIVMQFQDLFLYVFPSILTKPFPNTKPQTRSCSALHFPFRSCSLLCSLCIGQTPEADRLFHTNGSQSLDQEFNTSILTGPPYELHASFYCYDAVGRPLRLYISQKHSLPSIYLFCCMLGLAYAWKLEEKGICNVKMCFLFPFLIFSTFFFILLYLPFFTRLGMQIISRHLCTYI